MILSLTMNPSVDIAYNLDVFNLDTTNRVEDVRKTPGGKGLNVTRVLNDLKIPVVASGLLGGALGTFIEEGLDADHIDHDFYHISGQTRNCIAILHAGNQTEILEAGPVISEAEAQGFVKHFSGLLKEGAIVTMSGSLPKGLSKDFYAKLIEKCAEKSATVLLDTSGESLAKALQAQIKPFLIKPNNEELAQLLGTPVQKEAVSILKAIKNPLFAGLEWVVVSMGGQGAVARHGDRFYKVEIPQIEVVNPVGSGDSTVAGFAAAFSQGMSDEGVLKYGMTTGMLNAQEKTTGHVNPDNFDELFHKVRVSLL